MVGEMVQNSQRLYSFTFNAFIIIHEYTYSHATTKFMFKKYINSDLTTYFVFTNIMYSHLRDVFIHIQRFIFIHIHDRNVGSTWCNIHSTFSAHHLRASLGPSSHSKISECNMADEGRTII